MNMKSFKSSLDNVCGYLIRFVIGASLIAAIIAMMIFVPWVIKTIGTTVVMVGIFVVAFIWACYGVGCSIYPHKGNGEK